MYCWVFIWQSVETVEIKQLCTRTAQQWTDTVEEMVSLGEIFYLKSDCVMLKMSLATGCCTATDTYRHKRKMFWSTETIKTGNMFLGSFIVVFLLLFLLVYERYLLVLSETLYMLCKATLPPLSFTVSPVRNL